MFNSDDFKIFEDPTLKGRLDKIRKIIDPKFEMLGEELLQKYQADFDEQLYVHIAKHLRRHKNPPPDTWMAISTNKRGYKAHPHIEIGLWPENFYFNLSFLAEIEEREEIVNKLKKINFNNKSLQVSTDHTTSEMEKLSYNTLEEAFIKYLNNKNKDLVIGYKYPKEDFDYSVMKYDFATLFKIFSQFEI